MSIPNYDSSPSSSSRDMLHRVPDTKDAKIRLLKKIKDDCFKNVTTYKKKFRKLKRLDTIIDVSNSLLTGTSISLTVLGFTMPPLLIASASSAGLALL